MTRRVLVTGGARSGKSTWAEQQLWERPAVDYVATSYVNSDDPEWVERVRLHRERRPSGWRTLETMDLVDVLRGDPAVPVMVDCLTLWLTRVMDEVDVWSDPASPALHAQVLARVDDLCAALRTTAREVIFVTNEVGLGVVPADAGTRAFRDLLGACNARVAAVCDEVWICHVGIAKRWA